MSQEYTIKIKAVTGEAKKNIKEVGDEVKKTNEATTELNNIFDKASGGLISRGKQATSTLSKLSNGLKLTGSTGAKAFQAIKIAIASTGIGLLIIALGSLITYFTKTQRGADKIKQVFAGVGAAVNAIVDRISGLGESLTKLFSGDWRGALDGAKDAFKGLGDEIRSEVAAAVELEAALQKIRDREIDLIISSSELRKEIAKDKLVAEDRNKTFEERIEALDRVLENENKIFEAEKQIAIERRDNLQKEIDLSESSAEDLQALAEAKAKVNDLEAASLTRQKEAFTRRQALLQEQTNAENAAVKAQFDAKQASNKAVEDLNQLSIANFQNKIATETRLTQKGMTDQLKIYQAGKKQEQVIDKVTAEQKLQVASQTLGAISGLLGQSSKAGKAAGIAQAIVNTYQGVTAALKADAVPFVEPFATITRIANAAAVLASGMQAVRQIKAVQTPSLGGAAVGGGGGASGGMMASTPPQLNTVGSSEISQLAETIGTKDKQPVKAYVVSGEVTTAQALDRNTVNEASL